MKLLFCGTPDFAVPTLQAVHRAGHTISAVVTQPDRPRGRGMKLTPPPVKVAARHLGLKAEQPEQLRGEAGKKLLESYAPEAVVIVGYGQIIPADLLTEPQHGWINLHASLLPRYRGAAPIQWALIRGETVTGVTTMQIDAGLDTGPVLLQEETAVEPHDTTLTLGERLATMGAELMVRTLAGLESGAVKPVAQNDSRATKAPLLKKEHGKVDWSWGASQIYNRIRGLVPWPGAYTTFRGKLLHVWWGKPVPTPAGVVQPPPPGTMMVEKNQTFVACGPEGGERASWLHLLQVQLADRKRVAAVDFVNGMHVTSGEKLGSS